MNDAKVLVADDDPATNYAFSRVLRAAGYRTLSAQNGAECSRLVQEELPDLVLLDVKLPDIDGFELCRRIKSDPRTAHVLVIHASGLEISSERQAAGLEGGADGYLTKPIDDRVLLAHVRALLRIREVEATLAEQRVREVESLLQFSASSRTSVASRHFGATPLRQSAPEPFSQMVQRYVDYLDASLEQQLFKVDNRVSEGLRRLADELGFLRAGPRDVVDLHSTAIRACIQRSAREKAQAYLEEGRLLVLELMGYLVLHYRNHSIGARPHRPGPSGAAVDTEPTA